MSLAARSASTFATPVLVLSWSELMAPAGLTLSVKTAGDQLARPASGAKFSGQVTSLTAPTGEGGGEKGQLLIVIISLEFEPRWA